MVAIRKLNFRCLISAKSMMGMDEGLNQSSEPAKILIGFFQKENGPHDEDQRDCQQEGLGKTDPVGF